MKTQLNQHVDSLLGSIEALLWNKREVRTFRALVALFLDTELRTTLQNITGISASTASRFLSCEHAPDKVFWEELNAWQFAQFYRLPRRGRRGDVRLKIDLTCIEKTGKHIPFARVFNKRFGIQLVVLHACIEGLSVPLGYRIYQGKGKNTPVELALELLETFPAARFGARVVVLADSGFSSRDFITGCHDLGFTRLLLGMKCDRRLEDGRRLDKLTKRGEQVALHDLPEQSLHISWCDVKRDGGKKRFYVAATFKAGGAYLAKCYRQRWLIESFFKSVKHDFGLKEARVRTQTGIRLWIFLACLAFSLASLQRSLSKHTQNLLQAATCILDTLTDVRLVQLMSDCERLARTCRCPLKLVRV